jgi:hypothetical protein
MNKQPAASQTGPAMPWWRVGMVWLVFGGPAVVVVASFITLGLAIRYYDRPILEGVRSQPDATMPDDNGPDAATPAEQARNHAATPHP